MAKPVARMAAHLLVSAAIALCAYLWRGWAGVALWTMIILGPLLVLRPGFWLVLRPLLNRYRGAEWRSSRYLAWTVLLWAGLSFSLFSQREVLLSARLEMPFPVQVLGFIVGLMSPLLSASTLWTLGWARAICIPVLFGEKPGEPPALVTSGPYRLARNPMYLSELCALLGVFLLSGLDSALCAFLLWLPMTVIVIPMEEKELRARFGPEQWEAYARRVPRLVPGLW
jgi:protein-S-isoprenylcysteine O-methyltransferase Ste14